MGFTSSLIIPAAGSGQRFGGNIAKQFVLLDNIPILTWTIRAFLPFVNEVILVGDDTERLQQAVDLAGAPVRIPIHITGGGATRMDSVANGLRFARYERVLIHDAVRPSIKPSIIQACLNALDTSPAAVVAVPCTATVKKETPKRDNHPCVQETIPRDGLWLAQTPQGVHRDKALLAYGEAQANGWACTDDAQVMERAGHPVCIVPGCETNIKITTRADLLLTEWILAQRRTTGDS